jgi:multidrug efflux system membrane fusion protein
LGATACALPRQLFGRSAFRRAAPFGLVALSGKKARPLMTLARSCWQLSLFLLALGALAGCGRKPLAAPDTAPPTVIVTKPTQRNVTDTVDFNGRTDAVFSTDIRSRVTGYLVGMPFQEGAVVKKDDVLFEIDDRPYKATLDEARASLELSKAALVKNQANYDIGLAVAKQEKGAISEQELAKRLGARDESKASVDQAKASLDRAQLNYDWCKVRSPIDGRVSRYNLTLGNLVTQDQSLLTTVVSEDPIYVYFDMDENTMLHVLRTIILPSKVDVVKQQGNIEVRMGLADEPGFPHTGHITFANNVVNPSTGTITVRGEFKNPGNTIGRRLLRPGMFVRVRLPLGKPHPALLVDEKALGTDQGQKYLLVVNANKVVEYRRVKTGAPEPDGLRVIEEGIKPGEWVIVSGLQMVRPGMQVVTEEEKKPAVPGAGEAPGPAPEAPGKP